MKSNGYAVLCTALVLSVACLSAPVIALASNSGQTADSHHEVEPALNDANGSPIYLLSPLKNPSPSKANAAGTAPIYMVAYPLVSAIPSSELDCQPTNCDHLNVLPFPDTDYGTLAGSDQACNDFNGGNPCSPLEGHDHLVGIASTGGDYNQAWHVELVLFTHAAFEDGKINSRVTTLSQLQALVKSGDAIIVDTGFTFNCSLVPEQTYDLGTPVVISYP